MISTLALAGLLALVTAAGQMSRHSGTWRAVDTTMGGRGDTVPTPMDLDERRSAVTSSRRELTINEQPTVVEVTRAEPTGRTWTLPLTGLAVQTLDRNGAPLVARAVRDGGTLVILTEQRVRLPDGSEVLVETEARHVLLSDGSLQVTTVARSGRVTQTRQMIYYRVQ